MATAIERNFDTMGYRMYFAKIPKFSQEQIDWYTEQYQLCEEQPEIALEKIQRHYIYQRCTWETSKEFMTKKSTPFAVTDHICYFVYQIHQLYQTIDFKKRRTLNLRWVICITLSTKKGDVMIC